MAFDDDWDPEAEEEYFDAALAQKHLLIIRAFDAPRYYRTENNQDGMVHPNKARGQNFKPFPNMVVRCAVADLDAEDGPKVYADGVLFPSSITKIAKAWVGKGPQLLMWRKGPNQTDPYELRNMRNDPDAVDRGKQFLADHPEFLELKGPEPYDESPPEPEDDRRDRRRDDRDDRRDYRDDDRRDRRRDDDDWGRPARRDDRGARDNGQHDDRRRGAYDRDPWNDVDDARRRNSDSRRESRRDDRDGSFMSRSAESSRRGYQDEEPPF